MPTHPRAIHIALTLALATTLCAPIASAAPGRTSPAVARLGVVTSWDAQGRPSFFWASRRHLPRFRQSHGGPEAAARHYLAHLAPRYRLPDRVARDAHVRRVHDSGQGPILVALGQRVDGVVVLRSEMKLLLTRALRLVAVGGNLHAATTPPPGPWIDALAERRALAVALGDLFGHPVGASDFVPGPLRAGDWRPYRLRDAAETPVRLTRDARVRPVFVPRPGRLVPAFQLELVGARPGADAEAFEYVIAADGSRVLGRRDLTQHQAYTYRVWADASGGLAPSDGPHADYTPHPASGPDLSTPAYVPGTLVTVEGLNTNPDGEADPWLSADATETRGNNVEAYVDLAWPQSYQPGLDQRAPLSAAQTFDHPWDPALLPLATDSQRWAPVVQLFYTVNWLHDYFYDSGFDELAGNAQASNHGRGGEEADPIVARVEGKLTGYRNNASMMTPADGASPEMRMGLWHAGEYARVEAISQVWDAGTARFGATQFDVTAEVVLVDDGTGLASDGCEPLLNGPSLAGRIALIDRGGCSFVDKVQRAEDASAVGVIVVQDTPGAEPSSMSGGNAPTPITIGALMITYGQGEALRAALSSGPVSARLVVDPEAVQGALDNSVVAHEWGHYLHHRLQHCNTHQCRSLSEGWADFVSLLAFGHEGDDPDGTYAAGGYSRSDYDYSYYFGVRRVAYSVDPTRNALSFRHISDGEALPTGTPLQATSAPNSEVHNAGEIWGTMLWEAYVALLKAAATPSPPYDWAAGRRRMADYVVAGLQLAPVDPTFTEQRDAVMAAALARDPADFTRLAEAFARRGAGTCAVAPSRDSTDLTGVVEDFETQPDLRVIGVRVDDRRVSCDGDGVLDAQEFGAVVVELQNTGTAPLLDAEATLTATSDELLFPAGTTAVFGVIEPFETAEATVQVVLDHAVSGIVYVDLQVDVYSSEACQDRVTHRSLQRLNVDDFPSNSATDNVESDTPEWVVWGGADDDPAWVRVEDPEDVRNHFWRGRNVAYPVDTQLVSPTLQVSPSRDLVIRFRHRHSFEVDGEPRDGGLVEISPDDGGTWHDLADYLDPGYTGTLPADTGNPLEGRAAFVGQSAAWPAFETVEWNLGRDLSARSVKLRFRLATGTDGAAPGWEIDEIGFGGLTNTPFRKIVPDETDCSPPLADAGPDQTAAPGDEVALDGSASRDPQGAALAFSWTQIAGPAAPLTGADTATPALVAPEVADATALLTFRLTVASTSGTAMDEVSVLVSRAPGEGGGCGCRASGRPGPLSLLLLLLLVLAQRRRR